MTDISRNQNLDSVLELGNSSDQSATIAGIETTNFGQITTNTVSGNQTIITGKTITHPRVTIPNGATYTIDAGATMIAFIDLTVAVGATLTINGDCYVIGS